MKELTAEAKSLIQQGHQVTEEELIRMAQVATAADAARTPAPPPASALPVASGPRRLDLPLTEEERRNHLVCRLCKHRDRRSCNLSGRDLKYHWVNWNCPAGKFPHQVGAKPAAVMAAKKAAAFKPSGPPLRSLPLKEYFDRVVVISLKRTPDRTKSFVEHIAAINWPFLPVEIFEAVDGTKVKPPAKWRLGGPVWGCLQSHRQILERAMWDGVERLLVLEDDARFASDYVERIAAFARHVPDDWHLLMLGGQQHGDGQQVKLKDGVVQTSQCERTHCYAASKAGIESFFHWCSRPLNKHVDWMLGDFQQSEGIRCYRPDVPVSYQAAGFSTILYRNVPVRTWNSKLKADAPPPAVETICFGLCVFDEPAFQLNWCLSNLRKAYPDAPSFVIADGSAEALSTEYEMICRKHGVDFIRGDRLKVIERGCQWWDRFFRQAMTCGTDRVVKMDADTWVRRPLAYLPSFELAGTPDGGLIQGGFQILKMDTVKRIVESGILNEDRWARPAEWSRAAEQYAKETGQLSTDLSLIAIVNRLKIDRGAFPEIDSRWKPPASFRDAAVTHPHKHKIDPTKVVTAPHFGEFGWLVMEHIRWVHQLEGDKIVCCERGQECLFPSATGFHFVQNPVPDAARKGMFPKDCNQQQKDAAARILKEIELAFPDRNLRHQAGKDVATVKFKPIAKPFFAPVDVAVATRKRALDIARNFSNWSVVIEQLKNHGLSAAIVGRDDTSEFVGGVQVAWTHPDGATAGTVDLLSHCKVFLGTDTGVSHLAALMDVPSVLFRKRVPSKDRTEMMQRVNRSKVLRLPESVWDAPDKIVQGVEHFLADPTLESSPSGGPYYAQHGEDKWLEKNWPILGLPSKGIVVEVGVGNGQKISNSLWLEEHGWDVLLVEPDPRNIESIKKLRRCPLEECAIGRSQTTFFLTDNPDLSGFLRKGREFNPRVRGLSDLLTERGVGEIDVLSIDTEGTELEVWDTLDLSKNRPRVVFVEWNTVGLQDRTAEITTRFVKDGYRLETTLGGNLVFVHSGMPARV